MKFILSFKRGTDENANPKINKKNSIFRIILIIGGNSENNNVNLT